LRIYKSRWFERFARKESIADAALHEAVSRAERGLIDADLGGDVIKQRIARAGQGRSKGYRTVILFRRGARAVFTYGFAKSQRSNIDENEQDEFKQAARYVPALSERQLSELLQRGDFLWR